MVATRRVTLRAQWLGQQLRQVREEAGLTLKEVGDYINRDASTISRMEYGMLPARIPEVLAYLDVAGVDDPTRRTALRQLAQDVWQKGWWDGYDDDIAATLIDRAWLESRARRLCAYETNIPGLLQTEEYASAIISGADADLSPEQVARRVDVRLNRQRVLDGENPLELHIIMDEAALRRAVAAADTMRHQFQRLVVATAEPHITLQVVPMTAGAHPGVDGAFTVICLPEPYPEVACVDSPAGAVFVEGVKAERLRRKYDRLHALALDPDASAALITKAAEDLEQPDDRRTAGG